MTRSLPPANGLFAALILLVTAFSLSAWAETGTVEDIDGNVYATVKIGDQWWMAENLRVTHDLQGNSISSLVYADDPANEAAYGRLYSWSVAMNGATSVLAQGIAPEGWRIPTEADWLTLIDFLGGVNVAGGKMKEVGYVHWDYPNTSATNSSGFTARAAGGYSDHFHGFGIGTHFWSTEQDGSDALIPTLGSSTAGVLMFSVSKNYYHSIRCVSDDGVSVVPTTWSRLKALPPR